MGKEGGGKRREEGTIRSVMEIKVEQSKQNADDQRRREYSSLKQNMLYSLHQLQHSNQNNINKHERAYQISPRLGLRGCIASHRK